MIGTAKPQTATTVLGLGEWDATAEEGAVLSCLGLGSCVAFAARDPVAEVIGMAHMVLPDSTLGRGGGGKFVDTAIPLVLDKMKELGALRSRLTIYLVGGSQMLAKVTGDHGRIGERNAEVARLTLASLRLPVKAEDLGGNRGRTVRLHRDGGEMTVSTAGEGAHVL